MVGGIVIGLARSREATLLHVQDTGDYRNDRCSVRVIEQRIDNAKAVRIGLGDSVWWQDGQVLWTPKVVVDEGIDFATNCGKTWDIALPKVGYSH